MGFWSKLVDSVGAQRDGDYYIARTVDRVGKFIQFMLSARCSLHLKMPGNDDSFRSSVISVDIKSGEFQIDEVTPRDGNELLVKGKTLQMIVQSKGLSANFKTKVKAVSKQDAGISYVCEIPDEIKYKEDRAHYRYLMGVKRAEFVIVEQPGEKTRGVVFDVSEGGLGALLDGGYTLRVGASYPCFITFEKYDRIVADLLVRHIKPDKEDTSKRRVGLEFNSLEAKDKRTVRTLCDILNREFLNRIFK